MKTRNLIITFGLCSLILSPASIFGMKQMKKKVVEGTETLKKIAKKKRRDDNQQNDTNNDDKQKDTNNNDKSRKEN